jgi:hypothetical protein
MKTFADLKETFDRGRKSTEHSFMVQARPLLVT